MKISGAALLLLLVMSWPAPLLGQTSGSIAGMIRDESGAVLPGVTIEASSPALIEKVRVTVSDGQGVFRIIDLPPGTYTVVFTLPGFNTFRREGVGLNAGFAASVDAVMTVGALEETITVTGAAPVVDTQNVIQQTVLPRETRDAIPLPSNQGAYVQIIPGATQTNPANQDVGGKQSESTQQFTVHGSRAADFQQLRDGMFFGTLLAAGNFLASANPASAEEVIVQAAGGLTAENETGGAQINLVPRAGGNIFSGTLQYNAGANRLQSGNLDDTLRARGATSPSTIKALYEIASGVGGPIMQDKLWFFADARSWVTNSYLNGNFYNKRQGTLFYEPDLERPAFEDNFYQSTGLRLTWQANQKHKVALAYGLERNCNCNFNVRNGTFAPEVAGDDYYWPFHRVQGRWTYPATTRLLFEAGGTLVHSPVIRRLTGGSYDDVSVLELATNYRYGTAGSAFGLTTSWGENLLTQNNQMFAVSYVTGSHNFKTGITHRQARRTEDYFLTNNYTTYTFRNRVPTAATFWAGPYFTDVRQRTIALFAQDQWTIDALTLNVGLRFDYLNGWIPEQHLAAGPWVPERRFEPVRDALAWTDLNPRVSAAYDLFGDRRTAVKAFFGRFVTFQSNAGLLAAQNPVLRMISSSTRQWVDANGDYVPQEGELGPHSASNFGQLRPATTYDESVTRGFGVREYSWQGSVSLQHELRPGVAMTVGYFRTSYGNFVANENLAVSPEDHDEYCITAPADSRLSGGGGDRICGLFDLNPARFGRVNNFVTHASNFGDQVERFHGVDLTLQARFRNGGLIVGGVSTGSTLHDTCAFNDLPHVQPLTVLGAAPSTTIATPREPGFCRVSTPWSAGTQLKLLGVVPLPWDFRLSGTYQDIAGIPLAASYVASNAQVRQSLGRNLAACGSAAVCNATATIDLIAPNTRYVEGRNRTVSVRFNRRFEWRNTRIEPQIDVYNLLNANDVLVINTRYGPAWQNVSNVLSPRLVKFGVQINY